MGSLEVGEEELVQMVRDYIEVEPFTSISDFASPNQDPVFLTLMDILAKQTDEEAEIHVKIMKYLRDKEICSWNKAQKLVVMNLKLDGFEASICKTSCESTKSHHQKVTRDYEYIEVVRVDKNGRQIKRVIVDLDFKSQFEIARPTQSYRDLISNLPEVFVGTEEKLKKMIPLLCSAAKKSLRENGLHIPPWRRASYMQSKWLSKNSSKVYVSPTEEGGFWEEQGKGETISDSSTCFPCQLQCWWKI